MSNKVQRTPFVLVACLSLVLLACGEDSEDPVGFPPVNTVDANNGVGGFINDTATGCTPNCTGRICGNDGCGGSCGQCPSPQVCSVAGLCSGGCQANCAGKQCGPNGCGGSCGQCAAGQQCSPQFTCVNSCTPNCVGKQCGNNGCGGTCGQCPAGQTCNAQQLCKAPCTSNCVGKQCGNDGCGGTCGTCAQGTTCNAQGVCIKPCASNCLGKQCGDDGCGGNCGACPQNKFCKDNQCVDSCTANCDGKECGDDGCGGSCGNCSSGKKCVANQCKDATGNPNQCDNPDSSEANETQPGKKLGDIEDCDDMQPTVKATIHNGDDVDWYQYTVEDKKFCDVEPTVKFNGLTANANLSACVFYTCNNGKKANIKCKGDDLKENTELGENTHGCCTTLVGTKEATITVKPKCSTLGVGNESGKVDIRVTPKETTNCAMYSFEWGDK